MNAIAVWASAIDDVAPAKNSNTNHSVESNCPKGSLRKTMGSVTKASANASWAIFCTSLAPRKAKASGIASDAPKITSANSLVALVVRPESTMSSFLRR